MKVGVGVGGGTGAEGTEEGDRCCERFCSKLADPSNQMASWGIVDDASSLHDVLTFSVGCAISCCSLRTKGFLFIQVIPWMGLCGQM